MLSSLYAESDRTVQDNGDRRGPLTVTFSPAVARRYTRRSPSPMLPLPPVIVSVVTGTLASMSGGFYYAVVTASQSDKGLAIAAAITGTATIIAAVASCANTYMLTRVARRTNAVKKIARESAENLSNVTVGTEGTDDPSSSL